MATSSARAAARGGSNWGVPASYRDGGDAQQCDRGDDGSPALSEADSQLLALLQSVGAEAAFEALREERVDVEALALMGERDLKEAGVPLGPRKKLLHADVCSTAADQKIDSHDMTYVHATLCAWAGSVLGLNCTICWWCRACVCLTAGSMRISHVPSVLRDVEELQGVTPQLVLHLNAGRVHSTIDGDVAGAGILINEDDVPFLILMCKVNYFWRQRPRPWCFLAYFASDKLLTTPQENIYGRTRGHSV